MLVSTVYPSRPPIFIQGSHGLTRVQLLAPRGGAATFVSSHGPAGMMSVLSSSTWYWPPT